MKFAKIERLEDYKKDAPCAVCNESNFEHICDGVKRCNSCNAISYAISKVHVVCEYLQLGDSDNVVVRRDDPSAESAIICFWGMYPEGFIL